MITQNQPTRKGRRSGRDAAEAAESLFPLRSPQLGPLVALALLALLIFQIALARYADSGAMVEGTQAWLACVWSSWMALVWILVKQPLHLGRTIGVGVALAWHCALAAVVMEHPPERYVVTLGGYGLLQAVAVILLGLPVWRGRDGQAVEGHRRHQFSISAVIVLTTGVAMVLYGGQLYQHRLGIDPEDGFMAGSAMVSALVCLVAITAIVTSTVHSRGRAGSWMPVVLGPVAIAVVGSLAAAGVAWLDPKRQESEDFARLWRSHAGVLVPAGAILFIVGLCGRRWERGEPAGSGG